MRPLLVIFAIFIQLLPCQARCGALCAVGTSCSEQSLDADSNCVPTKCCCSKGQSCEEGDDKKEQGESEHSGDSSDSPCSCFTCQIDAGIVQAVEDTNIKHGCSKPLLDALDSVVQSHDDEGFHFSLDSDSAGPSGPLSVCATLQVWRL